MDCPAKNKVFEADEEVDPISKVSISTNFFFSTSDNLITPSNSELDI